MLALAYFIHLQPYLHPLVQIRDLSALIAEVHRVLRPGGLLLYGEYQNHAFDASTEDHTAIATAPCIIRALRIARDIFTQQGVYAYAFRDVPPLLDPECMLWKGVKRKGFTGIRAETKMVPAGPWHLLPHLREVGLVTQRVWCETWRNLKPMFLSSGMGEEEVDQLINGTVDELSNPGSRRLYAKYHVLYAFKPV